jgi:hypothetical protein
MRSFPIFPTLLALCALALFQAWAADPPGDEDKIVWPKDVQEVLRTLKLAEERANREFENKLFALRAPALEKIKAAQDRVTKEGNLEGAVALKKLGEKVSAGTAVPAEPAKDILGVPIATGHPVGKWRIQNPGFDAVVAVSDDGSIVGINDKGITGKISKSENGVSIKWWNGRVYDLVYISKTKLAGDKDGSMPKFTKVD